MYPVLKWAGGKTQIIDLIKTKMPNSYNNYYEPFVGGGALVLAITPKQAHINDTNEQLFNLYMQIKNNPLKIIEAINELDANPCDKSIYCTLREKYNKKISSHTFDAECAALMIWLNKHCFNGLYRVNSKGFFNVPYNNKTKGASISENNFQAIAKYFQETNITITCRDFEAACQNVSNGDFVYFDSPYAPLSETANFTNYTKDGFAKFDHERLAKLFVYLDSIGAKLMLSNNNVPLIHKLYANYNIETFDVKRMINRDAQKRTSEEVLITNY